MAKKYFQRALSVGLSLALCASMVAPGLAASFGELQGAINGSGSVYKDGYSETNKAEKDEDTYKIKAEDKDGTRFVTLYEDVEFVHGTAPGTDGYQFVDDQDARYKVGGITIGGENGDDLSKNVTLDLNGHDIDLMPGWELDLSKTDPDSTETDAGMMVNKDTKEEKWYNQEGKPIPGNVVLVNEGATLTLKDGTQEGSANPETEAGKIKGGMVGLRNYGTTFMEGGEISGNVGGGDSATGVVNGGRFILNGGKITQNRIGGVYTDNSNNQDAIFIMNGGEISDNVGVLEDPSNPGQFIYKGGISGAFRGAAEINGGTISGNRGAAGYYPWEGKGKIKISGGTFVENGVLDVGDWGCDTALNNLGTLTLPEGCDGVTLNEDGSIDLPGGTKIEKDGAEVVYLSEIHVEKDGTITNEGGTITRTDKDDGTTDVTVTDGEGNETTVTVPTDKKDDVTVGEDGTITVPEGGKVTDKDGNETELPNGGEVKPDGTIITKTDNGDGTTDVTVTDKDGNETTVTVPTDKKDDVTVGEDGTITVPEGGKVTDKDGNETELPNGGKVNPDGTVTGDPAITKTDKDDGTTDVTVTDGEGNQTTVTVPTDKKDDVTVGEDGTITVPEGGKVTDKDGNETELPNGGKVNPDGTVTGDPAITRTEKEDGTTDVTFTDGEGNQTNVNVPTDKKDDVTVGEDGTITVPEGGKVTDKDGNETELPNGGKVNPDGTVTGDPAITKTDNGNGTTDVTVTDGEGNQTTVTVPTDKKDDVTVGEDGTITVPEGGKVTDKDGNEYELPEGGKITEDGKVVDKDDNPVAPKKDSTNAGGGTGVSGSTDVVVIDGVEVPLAGLVSVEDVLGVLYRLAEGVDGEHDDVIAWAVENGIIDDETDVEELVTVAALRAILANYARAFELDVDVTTLATLAGEDDDIVMNCDEVIGEFFAKSKEDEAA